MHLCSAYHRAVFFRDSPAFPPWQNVLRVSFKLFLRLVRLGFHFCFRSCARSVRDLVGIAAALCCAVPLVLHEIISCPWWFPAEALTKSSAGFSKLRSWSFFLRLVLFPSSSASPVGQLGLALSPQKSLSPFLPQLTLLIIYQQNPLFSREILVRNRHEAISLTSTPLAWRTASGLLCKATGLPNNALQSGNYILFLTNFYEINVKISQEVTCIDAENLSSFGGIFFSWSFSRGAGFPRRQQELIII